jgi:hypothetical protein
MRHIVITTTALLLVLVTPVLADTTVRTGDQVSVTNEQNVAGNFYAVGNSVVMSGDSNQDLTMIGGKVRLDGSVAQDVLAVGVTVLIDGPVAGDVRVVGGDVTISSAIAGDLVVVGGVVEVLSSGSVGGDILSYARSVTVNGPVIGDVLGQIDQLTINAAVTGGIDVGVTEFTLGDAAAVEGTVRYTSSNLVTQAFNASIGGDIIRNDPVYIGGGSQLQTIGIIFLVVLLSSFVWYFLSRSTLARSTEHTLKNVPRSAVTGVVALFVLPLIIAVLAVSYLGIFVAIICFFGYVTLLLLACAALPAVVGQLVLRLFNQPYTKLSPLSLVVGSVTCSAIVLFPMIGVFVVFFAAVVVFGGLVESIIRVSR